MATVEVTPCDAERAVAFLGEHDERFTELASAFARHRIESVRQALEARDHYAGLYAERCAEIAQARAEAFAFGDDVWPGIAKLAEECGEVVQVIGKLMMTHGDPAHWSGNLREMLIEEMADVEAAICFVRDHCLTATEMCAMSARVAEKRDKFTAWHADMGADPPPPLRALKETTDERG